MCGITGLVYHDRARAVSQEELQRMCDSLVHRGPDDEGFFRAGPVGLGARRLSIIDLVTGHQPIANEDGRIWVALNGEIYNYLELRKDLEQKGHRFSTQTDTEAIVHAYEEYGEDCVTRFNGMFAFAIWDGKQERLLLARDRLGVKPLYYFVNERCLLFGSEPKALLKHPEMPKALDLEALDHYVTFEYIPAPLSIFQGMHKLLPGHLLVLQHGQVRCRRYWELNPTTTHEREDEIGHAFYDLLKDAVRLRLISDVPLGAFLSGGIDSSTIVCLMSEIMDRPVKTFSIGFEDPSYNELPYARAAAQHFGTEHCEALLQPDVVHLITDLLRYLDEPMADVSIFPTYLVSQLARQQVTVVLSGDGGDELLAGYDWYIADQLARTYDHLPAAVRHRWLPQVFSYLPPTSRKKGLVNKLKRFVDGAALPEALQHFRWNVYLPEASKRQLYTADLYQALAHQDTYARFTEYLHACPDADRLWQQQYADINTFLVDDILLKVDRMSMAHSLEARTPFLDYRVVEFAMGLPRHLKLRGRQSKYLLKQQMASKLPREILTRGKEGFSIPMKNWLQQELRPLLHDVLSPARLKREGLFNPAWVERLTSEHVQGKANHAHQLWTLMLFEIWRDTYLR